MSISMISAVIMHWWSSQSWSTWVRRRVKSGHSILRKQTLSCSRGASGAPCETAFREREGVKQSWQIFEGVFHGAPELLLPMSKTSGEGITWLFKLKGKQEMHRQWKHGWVSWKSMRTLPSCVGMGSVWTRIDCTCISQRTQRIKGKRKCTPPDEENWQIGNSG